MDVDQFDKLTRKLDTLIKLMALSACKELPRDEQALVLSLAGLTSPEIAELLGSTDMAIRQAIHRAKTKDRTSARGEREKNV